MDVNGIVKDTSSHVLGHKETIKENVSSASMLKDNPFNEFKSATNMVNNDSVADLVSRSQSFVENRNRHKPPKKQAALTNQLSKLENKLMTMQDESMAGSSGFTATGISMRASRYAVVGLGKSVKGLTTATKYGTRAFKDLADNSLTAKKAFTNSLNFICRSTGSGLGKTLKLKGNSGIIENLSSKSDNIGSQTVYKTKSTINKGIQAKNGVKAGVKGIKNSAKTIKKTAVAIKNAVLAVKNILANPIVVKGLLLAIPIGLLVFVFITAISAVVSATSSTYTASDADLTDMHTLITKLDVEVEKTFVNYEKKAEFIFKNLEEKNIKRTSNMMPETNISVLLAYLTVTQQENIYSQAAIKSVKQIHKNLYTLSHTLGQEKIYETKAKLDSAGSPKKDAQGNIIFTTVDTGRVEYKLNVNLTGVNAEDYIEKNKKTLFKNDNDYSQYKYILENDATAMRIELDNPLDINWTTSSRYGWRLVPSDTSKSENHIALDIPAPENTPIRAAMTGTITNAAYDTSYGFNVVIEDKNGRKTRYAHCISLNNVNVGQEVKAGDVIAFVGSTGTSTGNHLHFEFFKKGKSLNPAFYIQK